MRRGYFLEGQLTKVLDHLNSIGIHAHKNHPKRTADGTYIEGEPFDYEVFCSPPHVFDAKEAKGTRWSLSNAKPSQIKHLLNCHNHGAEAYFLVLFQGFILRRFDVTDVVDALANGKGSLGISDGRAWDWQCFRTSSPAP